MLSNYYTQRHLASMLDATIRGWQICGVFSQLPDELIIAFEGRSQRLVVLCRANLSTLYLHGNISRARRNTIDLFEGCIGRVVSAVIIAPSDRIITFALDNGTRLIGLFYGPKSNVFLVDNSERILDAFKNPRELRNTNFVFPHQCPNPASDELRSELQQRPSEAVFSAVKKAFPTIGPLLALELLDRANVSPTRISSSLDEYTIERILAALRAVLHDLTAATPRVYRQAHGLLPVLSLIPIRRLSSMEARQFNSLSDAICYSITSLRAIEESNEEKKDLIMTLRRRLDQLRRTLRALQADAKAESRASEFEFFASTLMAHLPELSRGMHAFSLASMVETTSIPLLPSLSPAQNAQRYFEKAKRARVAYEGAVLRAQRILERISKGERLLANGERLTTKNEVKQFMRDHADELEEFGIGEKNDVRRQLPFRVFTVDGDFEVWVGKSGTSNDLLTLRYSKPGDFWFHVRGGSGSHVILKVDSGKGEPGKSAREQAASIAAFYSKMKNARLVPVAMTQKRYVRKPKGSPPGSVVIEREKVIFVVPGLPSRGQD